MLSLKYIGVILASTGLLLLGACSGGQETASTEKTSAASPVAAANTTQAATTEAAKSGDSSKEHKHDGSDDHSHDHKEGKEHSHGGQVVESGQYHLELATKKESDGIHMDFFLEKGKKHESVTNAKVSADVQLPDGTQKTIDLKYKPDGKHYFALLPGGAAGQYQVRINVDAGGEKVNGRFTVAP